MGPLSKLNDRRHIAVSLLGCALALTAYANEKKEAAPAKESSKEAAKPDIEATTASNPKDVGAKVREALGTSILPNKKLVVNVSSGKGGSVNVGYHQNRLRGAQLPMPKLPSEQ